jgi:hypothetical protein
MTAAQISLALGMAPAWRADPHRHQEARQDPETRASRHRQSPRAEQTKPERQTGRGGWLGVRARRDRRSHPSCLRRGPNRRAGPYRCRIPGASCPVLRRLRREGTTRDDRQRLALHLPRPRHGMPAARATSPAHPSLQTQNEREGGEVHPDPAGRVGLRACLPNQRRANRSTRPLAQPLQPQKTTRRPQPQAPRLTTDQRS